jgi:hypothetical protein
VTMVSASPSKVSTASYTLVNFTFILACLLLRKNVTVVLFYS